MIREEGGERGGRARCTLKERGGLEQRVACKEGGVQVSQWL